MENRQESIRLFLVKAMSDRDMSQSELAELLNTEPSYINRLVNGKKAIGLEVALKLAKIFNVSLDDLIFKEGERKPTLADCLSWLALLQSATPEQIAFVRSYLDGSALEKARASLQTKTRKP